MGPITPDKPTNTKPEKPTDPGEVLAYSSIDELEEQLIAEVLEAYDWLILNNVYDDDDFMNNKAYVGVDEYIGDLVDLDDRMLEVYDDCTNEQLKAFIKEFETILKRKESVKKAILAAYGGQ